MSSRRAGPATWRARAALVADVLIVLFLLAGSVSLITGGIRFDLLGLRLSLRTPSRPFLVAAALIVLRHLLWSYRPALARFVASARAPLPLEEEALEAPRGASWRARLATIGFVTFFYALLTIVATWPQAADLYSVSDLGDPLFSIWRLSWVHHQLFRDPLNLFNANIFYPRGLTLTYSDSMLVPSLMNMPLLWLGLHRVVAYNILFLSGFVLSGVTMFVLVRALTGCFGSALVAGAIFAVYPYRVEHFSHLELQMTMWMPLALFFLHRTIAGGRWRDGVLTGLAFALQMLSSLYYGVFLTAYMVVMGGVLWIARRFTLRPIAPLAAGGAVAAVLIAPVVVAYVANKPIMGERELGTIEFYSAEGPDYLNAHHRSRIYSSWSNHPQPERQLFPRFTPVVLTAVALAPPLSVARIGYTLALILSLDGSLGLHGRAFPWLHEHVSPFRGLRVPARFSILAGMTLAILAGFGMNRLVRRLARRQSAQIALVAAAIGAVAFEALPDIRLAPVWREPPAVYAPLEGVPRAVLAEFPMPATPLDSYAEFNYLYFSTFHWHSLVNGNSGFFPPSYQEMLKRETDFPSEQALAYLRSVGVQYITVHGAFYSRPRYAHVVAALDARSDLELITAVPWERSESRLYRLKPQT